jgi:iron complex transport system permease protein
MMLIVLLGIVFILSLGLGSVSISPSDVATILAGREPSLPILSTIVWDLRLPRTLTAILAGAALAAAGLQMQTMFRNPLAGPYVLGVDAGASLGVALVTLGWGVGAEGFLYNVGLLAGLGRLGAATLGAGATLCLVLAIAARLRSDVTLLVVGLLIGYFASGLVGVMVYMSVPESIQRYLQWTFGSFTAATWPTIGLLAISVGMGCLIALLLSKSMDALLLGEEYAESVGIAVRRVRWGLVIGSSILAASVTAICGPIGFIGVAVPHLARELLRTSQHRYLLPSTMLIGAIVAVIADIIARGPGDDVTLPLNAITSLFGAPLLVWLVLRRVEVSQ